MVAISVVPIKICTLELSTTLRSCAVESSAFVY